MPITYRSSRGSGQINGLTNAEIDGNFAFLEQNKEEAGVAATLLNQHSQLADPHPQYTTAAEAAGAAPVQSVAGKTGAVTLTKADVGLANVDNTSDMAKPISTAQQAALTSAFASHAAETDPHPQYTTFAEVQTAIAGLPPVVITESTTLTQAAHANRQLHINSSTPVTLTLPSSATLPCTFYGVNLGAGAVTIVQTGGTAVPANAILPSSIDQFSAFEVWKTSSDYVRIA